MSGVYGGVALIEVDSNIIHCNENKREITRKILDTSVEPELLPGRVFALTRFLDGRSLDGYRHQPSFLVDAGFSGIIHTDIGGFPGLSGAPVFYRSGNSIGLFGMIQAGTDEQNCGNFDRLKCSTIITRLPEFSDELAKLVAE